MVSIQVSSNASRYGQAVTIRQFQLIVDEPLEIGGDNLGPTPFELMLTSLGTCKAITAKMYAERKQWPLEHIHLEMNLEPSNHTTNQAYHIQAKVTLEGALNPDQQQRILEIIDRCPVQRLLTNPVTIQTTLNA